MKLVVPRFSTTWALIDEVRFAPEITKMACSGVLEPEAMAIGNLAGDEVTVTVRPAGRLSFESSLRIVASDAERYAWRRAGL